MTRIPPRLILSIVLLPLAACAGRQPMPPILNPAPVSLAGEPLGGPARDRAAFTDAWIAWGARADVDGDGRLTVAEVQADARRFAATLDLSGDGVIDAPELTRVRLADRQEMRAALAKPTQPLPPGADSTVPEGDDRRRGRQPRGTPILPAQLGPDPVMAADSNADFRVTPDELAAEAARKLALNDQNGDGALDRAELAAAAARDWDDLMKLTPRRYR